MTNTLKNMKGLVASLYMAGVAAVALMPKEAEAAIITSDRDGRISWRPSYRGYSCGSGGGHVGGTYVSGGKKKSTWVKTRETFKNIAGHTGAVVGGVRVGEAVGNGLGDLADIAVGNVVDFVGTGLTKGVQGAKDVCFGKDEENYYYVQDDTRTRTVVQGTPGMVVSDRYGNVYRFKDTQERR